MKRLMISILNVLGQVVGISAFLAYQSVPFFAANLSYKLFTVKMGITLWHPLLIILGIIVVGLTVSYLYEIIRYPDAGMYVFFFPVYLTLILALYTGISFLIYNLFFG